MNEGDTVEITVEEYEKANGKSASVTLKVVKKATENVLKGLKLEVEVGTTKGESVEMYTGTNGSLQAEYICDGELPEEMKGVKFSCDQEDLLSVFEADGSRFQIKSGVEAGTKLTFTVKSTYDESIEAKATVKVKERPQLKSLKIKAPEGYSISEEGIMEVEAGDHFTLDTEAEVVGNYSWEPDWSANWIYDKDGNSTGKNIQINAETGEVTLPEDMNEGDTVEVTVEEYEKANGKSASITLKVVKKAGGGELKGISISAPTGYTITNENVIEVYPDTKLKLIGTPDMTAGYEWNPIWSVGDTIDSEGKKNDNVYAQIKVNSETGEVTVPRVTGDGSTAEITLQQKNDTSGIKDTVIIKVVYWNVTAEVMPKNLKDTDVVVDPTRAAATTTVSYCAAVRGATDNNGQKYMFDHWETDEQNKDLQSRNYGIPIDQSTISGEYFRMPRKDVHLTAVFAKSWDVKENVIGAGNMPSILWNIGDYKAGTEVETYYYESFLSARHLVLQNIRVIKNSGEEVTSKVDTSRDNGTVYIYFTMPAEEVTIEITVARDPDADKSLSLGEVTGSLVNGTACTASEEVTASGYPDGEVLTVGESYADGTLKNESNRTAGLNFTVSSVTGEKAQVTIQTDETVPAGKYNFTVISSNGKKRVTGVVEVKAAEAKALTVKGTLIELEEDATGELTLKGTSLNLKNGTAVKAIETDAKGTEKTFGKTEGLVFDNVAIADNAFTMKAHLSKTVAAGTYYFKVQAGDTVSEVASIVVTRTKKEEPTPPVEEKEYSINASCNPNQGSIEIRVNGAEARKAKKGDKVTLTAVAKSGYKLKNWSLNMDMTTITPSEGTLTDTTVSFLMPEGTMTVGAAFESTGSEDPDTPTSVAPTITAFVMANVNGVIDQSNGQITVVVPNGTDVTALKPAVAVSDGATVTPNSGAAVNFTDAVVYTVTSASGETKQYVVTVKVQEASVSDSLWDQITNPEGDRSWWKKADSIKSHKKNKYPKYW